MITNNPLFLAFTQSLNGLLAGLFKQGYYKPNAIKHGIAGHKNILEAIRSKDIKKAKQAMAEHLETSKRLLFDFQ